MTLSENIIDCLKHIPFGRVASYGQIAALAGNPRAARQVVRLLHTCTKKHELPWHRVVNSKGLISLKPGSGYEIQKSMLESEGIEFSQTGKIDFNRFQWKPNHWQPTHWEPDSLQEQED